MVGFDDEDEGRSKLTSARKICRPPAQKEQHRGNYSWYRTKSSDGERRTLNPRPIHHFLTLPRDFRIFSNTFWASNINVLTLAGPGLLGYLLGSLPTAYLLVRWKADIDIRTAGTGNVGTLNSFEVTGSKIVGILVLLLDLLKGALAVQSGGWMGGGDGLHGAIAGVGAVVGHNFPVWLGFRGGRGLATAAGAMFMMSWICVPVWGVAWGAGFGFTRDVNAGNAFATIILLGIVLALPGSLATPFMPRTIDDVSFRVAVSCLLVVILLKLVDPVRHYLLTRHRKGAQ